MTREYRSYPDHYEANLREGAALHASPALLEHPNGTQCPGVRIALDRGGFRVVPSADAQRLALQIAGIIAAQRKEWA